VSPVAADRVGQPDKAKMFKIGKNSVINNSDCSIKYDELANHIKFYDKLSNSFNMNALADKMF